MIARRTTGASGAAFLMILLCASHANAATLTITPDKSVYNVGENIVLSVFGDAEGQTGETWVIGRLIFDSILASPVSATQSTLIGFADRPWRVQPLSIGPGFADAFLQAAPCCSDNTTFVPLESIVVLEAVAPGVLTYSWAVDYPHNFLFFSVPPPSPASVTIVPEPTTGLLLMLGLAVIATAAPRSWGTP